MSSFQGLTGYDHVFRSALVLTDALAGKTLVRGELRHPRLSTLDLTGREVLGVRSVGKHLFVRFNRELSLHNHLGMDGSWRLFKPGARVNHQARAVLATESTTAVGLNRVNWNIRYDNPPAFNHNYAQVMGAVPFGTPYTPEGPLALPGTYTVRLSVDGNVQTQTVTVRNDPRSPATLADLREMHVLQMHLYQGARTSWDGWHQVQAVRDVVGAIRRANPPAEVAAAAGPLDSVLARVQGNTTIIPANARRAVAAPNFATENGTEPGESVVLLSMNGQLRTTDYGDIAPTEAMPSVANSDALKFPPIPNAL